MYGMNYLHSSQYSMMLWCHLIKLGTCFGRPIKLKKQGTYFCYDFFKNLLFSFEIENYSRSNHINKNNMINYPFNNNRIISTIEFQSWPDDVHVVAKLNYSTKSTSIMAWWLAWATAKKSNKVKESNWEVIESISNTVIKKLYQNGKQHFFDVVASFGF